MRALAALVIIPLASGTATAPRADVLVPADYHAIMEKSPLLYSIGAPVTKPLPRLSCPRRHSEMRVVEENGERSLVAWTPAPAAAPHAEAAERHYGAGELAEAEREYAALLAIDPDYGPGWLFRGDVPFRRGDPAGALEHYRRALALDPTLPQAHRFAGDALAKLGRFAEAEEAYVQALAWDPGYSEAFDALEQLGRVRGFRVERFDWSLEAVVGERIGREVAVQATDADSPEQLAYAICQAVWQSEDDFKARHGSAPGAWSSMIEEACILAAASAAWSHAAQRILDQSGAPADAPEPSREEILARVPPWVRHLLERQDPAVLAGFVFFVAGGKQCPIAASLVPREIHDQVADYIRRFVIVRDEPAPHPRTGRGLGR